jgi:hypothetical protein
MPAMDRRDRGVGTVSFRFASQVEDDQATQQAARTHDHRK